MGEYGRKGCTYIRKHTISACTYFQVEKIVHFAVKYALIGTPSATTSCQGNTVFEYILKVFTDLKLPIKPIFLETPFNEIESGWAKFYCREIGNKLKIVNLDANNTINELKKRTFDRSLSSLLGGIPLFLGDYVKEMGGHLLTGHGCLDNKVSPDVVEFTENNYYLSDDNYHPGNFYDYNLALTYSHIKELKTFNVQLGKAKLYDLYYRPQVSWDIERVNLYLTNDYNISEKTTIHLEKNKFLETLEKYEIE